MQPSTLVQCGHHILWIWHWPVWEPRPPRPILGRSCPEGRGSPDPVLSPVLPQVPEGGNRAERTGLQNMELAPVQRKIEARSAEDSFTGFVRTLYFADTYLRDSEWSGGAGSASTCSPFSLLVHPPSLSSFTLVLPPPYLPSLSSTFTPHPPLLLFLPPVLPPLATPFVSRSLTSPKWWQVWRDHRSAGPPGCGRLP